jgi:putative FmdB family regulatory protein
MPTYEYACTECGHRFETVQSFSDDALTECPECHGALRKVFGSVGIVFKGSGFYKTDARGSSSASTPPPTETSTSPAAPSPAAAPAPATDGGSTSSTSSPASTSTD